MKKVLMFAAAAAALALSACSEAPFDDADGKKVTVSYKVTLPAELATRYGEGTQVKNLYYVVYEAGTKNVIYNETVTDAFNSTAGDLSQEVPMTLVTNKAYDMIFWADAGVSGMYTLDPTTQSVSVDYDKITGNFNEDADAFFAQKVNFSVSASGSDEVKMYRPFAQLNIGTDDLDKVKPEIDYVKVTVPVYSQVNLLSGDLVGEAANVTFTSTLKGASGYLTFQDFPVEPTKYKYLAMDYLLVNDRELVTVSMTTSDQTVTEPRVYDNVPVQRNYRTNIYGSLLTSLTNFNIEIIPDFNQPDYNYTNPISTPEELNAALAAGGEYSLTNDIAASDNIRGNASAPTTLYLNGNTLDLGTHSISAANTINLVNGNLSFGVTNYGIYTYNTGNVSLSNVIVESTGSKTVTVRADGHSTVNLTDVTIKSTNSTAQTIDIRNSATANLTNVSIEAPEVVNSPAIVIGANNTGGTLKASNINIKGEDMEAPPVVLYGNAVATITDANLDTPNAKKGYTLENYSKITIDNNNLPEINIGLVLLDYSSATVKNCDWAMNAYCVSTDATDPCNNTLSVENCNFTANTPILINVPGTYSIKDTELIGRIQGLFARGGDITVVGGSIASEFIPDGEYTLEVAKAYKLNENWGSGNQAPYASLTLGNRSTAYQYPVNLTLSGVALKSMGTYKGEFPFIYSWGNSGTGLGATLNYSGCSFWIGDEQVASPSASQIFIGENVTVNP